MGQKNQWRGKDEPLFDRNLMTVGFDDGFWSCCPQVRERTADAGASRRRGGGGRRGRNRRRHAAVHRDRRLRAWTTASPHSSAAAA